MAARTPRIPTFDELYARIRDLPQGITGEILEPGLLRTTPRPGRPHRKAAKLCLHSLRCFDIDHGGAGWWIEHEAEIRFGERLAVPDLAGWRVARVPALPEENPLTVLPDWCCEVLSPSTARDDRTLKLPLYARSGVEWVWLVDPALHTVEVYESIHGRATLAMTAKESDTTALPPFEGEIDLTPWWLPAPSEGEGA